LKANVHATLTASALRRKLTCDQVELARATNLLTKHGYVVTLASRDPHGQYMMIQPPELTREMVLIKARKHLI
jgi:hypothetical protein